MEDLEETSHDQAVLLACLRAGEIWAQQLSTLTTISEKYQHIKIKVLELGVEDDDYQNLHLIGTPTFILYHRGIEKSRLLGKVEVKTLSLFLDNWAINNRKAKNNN